MEIERKYLIKEIPFSLEAYPYKELEQRSEERRVGKECRL